MLSINVAANVMVEFRNKEGSSSTVSGTSVLKYSYNSEHTLDVHAVTTTSTYSRFTGMYEVLYADLTTSGTL